MAGWTLHRAALKTTKTLCNSDFDQVSRDQIGSAQRYLSKYYWPIRYHICNSKICSFGHLVVVFDMHLCILSVVVSLCDNLVEFKTYLETRYHPFFLLCFGSYLVIFRPCPDLKLSLVSHHNLQQSWLFPFCVNQAQLDYLYLIYSKSWGYRVRTEDQRTPHARFLSQMAQQELKGVIQNEILARRLKSKGFERLWNRWYHSELRL